MAGYLVLDRLDYRSIFKEGVLIDFRPHGAYAEIRGWPGEADSPSKRSEYIEEAMLVYDQLRMKGYKDIAMAMTLDSGAFEGLEMMYMDRDVSPKHFDDWLALKEVYKENLRREQPYWNRSLMERIVGFLKGKKYLASIRVKGVLAVARVKSNLGSFQGRG